MIVKLKNVRLAFADLFQPKSINKGDPRFSGQFIFEKDGKLHKEIEAAMKDLAIAKWGAKGEKILDKITFYIVPRINYI